MDSIKGNYPLEASEKSVLELGTRVVEILKAHPSRQEAKSALVIAGELLSLNTPRTFIGNCASSADKSLHKDGNTSFIYGEVRPA